jgi:two-component system phosphate regulon sensor histidine kinase PhoR
MTLKLDLPQKPLAVFLREEWIRQILINLVENAIKYSPAGTVIELGIEEGEGRLSLWVRDQGIGISQADQARIFERFYRVDKARSSRVKGSGLGLSIVKYMVKAMEGSIAVDSKPGQGSCFRASFPLEEKVSE